MTDLEYLLYIEGNRTLAYTDGHDAISDATKAKLRDPEAVVVLSLVTKEDADMTAEDFRVRPFAVSPDEQVARVVALTETERGDLSDSRVGAEPAAVALGRASSAAVPRSVSARANRSTR